MDVYFHAFKKFRKDVTIYGYTYSSLRVSKNWYIALNHNGPSILNINEFAIKFWYKIVVGKSICYTIY